MGLSFSYKYIPFIGTGVFILAAVFLFIYVVRVHLKEIREESKFDKQIKFSMDPDKARNEEEEQKESFITKILLAIPRKLLKAKLVKEDTSLDYLRGKLVLYSAMVFMAFTLITGNPFGGFFPLIFIYFGVYMFATFKINKQKELMDEQIPAFISIFKANIQARQHSQNAMINAINNTARPLYDELSRPKSLMEAGDFTSGIRNLRLNTENETLRQMASCIELASSSGSNIEEQIETIEEIVKDKQTLERKKRLGVNENKPLFIVAALILPASFIGSYLISEMHRDYWFSTGASYLILLGAVIVMLIASWATWKVIQKIDVG